jgi:UDP-glucose 4-epimerase
MGTVSTPNARASVRGCRFRVSPGGEADVHHGTAHPPKDLEQNTIPTFNILQAMRAVGVRRVTFSSTGSIYGEPNVFPTPEDAPFSVHSNRHTPWTPWFQ